MLSQKHMTRIHSRREFEALFASRGGEVSHENYCRLFSGAESQWSIRSTPAGRAAIHPGRAVNSGLACVGHTRNPNPFNGGEVAVRCLHVSCVVFWHWESGAPHGRVSRSRCRYFVRKPISTIRATAPMQAACDLAVKEVCSCMSCRL